MPQAAGAFFRDVADHAIRVYEQIETLDSAAVERARRPHGADLGAAERRHAQDLGLGRDRRRADRDRRHLRHELRAHARARLAYGYPIVLAVMAGHLRGPLPRLQEVRLALAASSAAQVGAMVPVARSPMRIAAERHPVGDEPGDRVVGHELEQPRHGGVRDDEADDRGDDGGARPGCRRSIALGSSLMPAPVRAGIDRKNDIRVAATRSRPANRPAEIVAPDRETPGTSDDASGRRR